MKIDFASYIKKTDSSVLVAQAIFSELETSHPLTSISEIANTSSGGTPSRSNTDYYGGNIPWLKSGELNDGIIESAEEFITEKGLANSSAKLHPENTLLLAMYGATAGRTGITKFKASTNQAVCALFPKSEIDQGFLFWFLRQHRYKFIEISKGGAQPNISQSVINSTKLSLPSMELQVEISSLLFKLEKNKQLDFSLIPAQFKEKVARVFKSKNSVSEIDAELNNQLSYLGKLRQAFLREAMQGKLLASSPLSTLGPEAETGQHLLEKIKAEKIQLVKDKKLKKGKELQLIAQEEIPFEIPKNWVWCRLGDIITFGPTNGYSPKESKKGTGIKCLTLSATTSGWFKSHCFKLVDEEISDDSYLWLTKGDILLQRGNSPEYVGIAALYEGQSKEFIYPDLMIKIRVPERFVLDAFIHQMLITPFSRSYFMLNATGAQKTMPKINQAVVLNTLIPLPPLSEQNRIVVKLNQLMQTCDQLEASIKQSQLQNEQLLQQVLKEALSGKEIYEISNQ